MTMMARGRLRAHGRAHGHAHGLAHARVRGLVRDERGAGAVLALALVAALATLALAVTTLALGLVERQRVVGAADNAALAAADVARGLAPGTPCEAAAAVAEAHGLRLSGCAVDGYVATVRISGVAAGVALTATATAGPPG